MAYLNKNKNIHFRKNLGNGHKRFFFLMKY